MDFPMLCWTLDRSYISCSPELLVTRKLINSIRSKVVNLASHFSHSRRLRIDFPSSAIRESITLVSRVLHFGQRMFNSTKKILTQCTVLNPFDKTFLGTIVEFSTFFILLMQVFKDFKDFALKGNVVDLAV